MGLVNFTASVVPISDGMPQMPLTIPNAWYANGIDCTSVGNCLMVGESGDDGEGYVSTWSAERSAIRRSYRALSTSTEPDARNTARCLLAGASQVGAAGYSHGVLVRDDNGEIGDVHSIAGANGFEPGGLR